MLRSLPAYLVTDLSLDLPATAICMNPLSDDDDDQVTVRSSMLTNTDSMHNMQEKVRRS